MENERKVAEANKSGSCLKTAGLIIVCITALAFIGPYLARLGYCRGWWLSSSPWSYYWWLCDCGPEVEQGLYPDNIEVVISACRAPQAASLSPDGRYVIVKLGSRQAYLLDMVADQIQEWSYHFADDHYAIFWTDTLVWVSGQLGQKKPILVDVTDSSVITPTFLGYADYSSQKKQLFVPLEALETFQRADKVVFREGPNVVTALDPNPGQNQAKNFFLKFNRGKEGDLLEDILRENGIAYEKIHICDGHTWSCVSHNGRFRATSRKMFTADGQLLTAVQGNPSFAAGIVLLGWAHDDSGVYIRPIPDSYIIEGGFITPPKYRLRQPILKLKVPEAYLE